MFNKWRAKSTCIVAATVITLIGLQAIYLAFRETRPSRYLYEAKYSSHNLDFFGGEYTDGTVFYQAIGAGTIDRPYAGDLVLTMRGVSYPLADLSIADVEEIKDIVELPRNESSRCWTLEATGGDQKYDFYWCFDLKGRLLWFRVNARPDADRLSSEQHAPCRFRVNSSEFSLPISASSAEFVGEIWVR